MLVLSRRLGEVIMVGDEIRITVVDIQSNQVKLGIDAPADTRVDRLEIWYRRQGDGDSRQGG